MVAGNSSLFTFSFLPLGMSVPIRSSLNKRIEFVHAILLMTVELIIIVLHVLFVDIFNEFSCSLKPTMNVIL